MANIVNNYSSSIVTMFKEVVKTYEMNLDIIKQAEEELNDLYHECELASPKDMYRGYLLYAAIRDTRIRRRNAKEENEMLKDMYEFFQSQQGQAFKSKIHLHPLLGDRTYYNLWKTSFAGVERSVVLNQKAEIKERLLALLSIVGLFPIPRDKYSYMLKE